MEAATIDKALTGLGLFAADRAELIDAGDLLRSLLGPFYDRFLANVWILAIVLVLGGIGWVAKMLDGGNDYGIEIHHDGVVWMRRPAERYRVPWSQVNRIWRLPIVDVDAFELVEPLQVSVGPDWRDVAIGAVLRRHAPHLFADGPELDDQESALSHPAVASPPPVTAR